MSPHDHTPARDLLCTWSRRMVRDGLVVGTSGNLSLRTGDLIAVTPSGVDYETMTAADVVLVDAEGTVVDGTREPTSELGLHVAGWLCSATACGCRSTRRSAAVRWP